MALSIRPLSPLTRNLMSAWEPSIVTMPLWATRSGEAVRDVDGWLSLSRGAARGNFCELCTTWLYILLDMVPARGRWGGDWEISGDVDDGSFVSRRIGIDLCMRGGTLFVGVGDPGALDGKISARLLGSFAAGASRREA